jgi:hypothetical protein
MKRGTGVHIEKNYVESQLSRGAKALNHRVFGSAGSSSSLISS